MKNRLLSLLAILALLYPAAALAQEASEVFAGELAAQDPVYQRSYVYRGTCYLSSIGSSVHFDVQELVLDVAGSPADLVARTCSGGRNDLDTVPFLYQRPDGLPGAFNPAQPCANLVAYDDDFCGPQSRVSTSSAVPGHVEVVVTTFTNGELGAYSLALASTAAPIERFLFYSGFEQGDARTWTARIE